MVSIVMKKRRQHIQNIISDHGMLAMSYESLEDHLHFKVLRKGRHIHLYFRHSA
jgi:hypothetical protein